MNQPYARVNQPYATLTLASALREMFGVQLYKNNARALLLRILSILNLDWLQHARSVWIAHNRRHELHIKITHSFPSFSKYFRDIYQKLENLAFLPRFTLTHFNFIPLPFKWKIMIGPFIWYQICNCDHHNFDEILNFQFSKNVHLFQDLPTGIFL